MTKCETCGNDYDKAFEVIAARKSHTFDSFACAIHTVAPTCAHCGCQIAGYDVKQRGKIFCWAPCASEGRELKDRA
jgi:hypothetical protein